MKKANNFGPKASENNASEKGRKLFVRGVKSLDGNKFIKARKGRQSAHVPYDAFMPGGLLAKYLREQKFILTGPNYRELQHKVDDIRSFSKAPLLEHPGWTDGYFAFPCGTVQSPTDRSKGRAIFARTPEKCAKGGKGTEWRDQLAALVANQTLPAFLIMVAFAAPLLRLTDRIDNFGFEVVGNKGTGKTTILRLMSTTVGAGMDVGKGVYWQTLGSTVAGLETSMERHQDLPMILDEAGLFVPKESKKDRASSMVHLAFQLGSGHTKSRWGDPQPALYRFIFVISSNEPASQTMQGNNHEREGAALDRLLTLPVPDGEHGVYDSLPEDYESSAAFSAAIDAAMRQYHGRALPRFLQLLVEERAASEVRLRKKIARLMRRFRRDTGIDGNSGSAVRVCDAFGLVYAAGRIAQLFDVLPRTYDCKQIALEAYRRHLACRDERSPTAKVIDLSRSDRVLKVPAGGQSGLTEKEIERHDGLVFKGRSEKELLLTRRQLHRLFPLVKAILTGTDLERLIHRDGDHQTVKRTVSPELKAMRFYCFPLDGLNDG